MQRKWYRSILEKDIDAVNGKFQRFSLKKLLFLSCIWGLTGKKEGKTRLMNMVMQVCFLLCSVICLLHCISLASQSDMPPIPLRWSSKSRIFTFGRCSYLVRNLDHHTQRTNISFKILEKWLFLINYSKVWKKRARVYWFLVKWVEFSTFSRTTVCSDSTVRYPMISLTSVTKILFLRRILSNWWRYRSRGSHCCHWRVQ